MLDPSDRRLVAALQIHPRATYRQLASALDQSESTVARRLQALLEGGKFRIAAHPDPLICGMGRPVLMRLRCQAGSAGHVATALATRPDVRFLAGVTGSYDLIMELIASSKRHLAQVLSYELNEVPGIVHTTSEGVLRTMKTTFDWSRGLLPPETVDKLQRTAPAPGTDRGGAVELDEDDLALIAGLKDDGRATYKDLAARTGLSESTVRRRVEALARTGALVLATLVEPAELGFDAEFFFHVRVQPDRLDAVADAFAGRPEVRYLSSSYGYGGLTGEVILPSQDDVYDFSRETFARLEGIHDVEIAMELETYKRGHMLSNPSTLAETRHE
jgi:DNA-binding Lrp family transcriptional regulator